MLVVQTLLLKTSIRSGCNVDTLGDPSLADQFSVSKKEDNRETLCAKFTAGPEIIRSKSVPKHGHGYPCLYCGW